MNDSLPKWLSNTLVLAHHYMKRRGLSQNFTGISTIYGIFVVDNNDVITMIDSPTKVNKTIPTEAPT